MAEIDKGLPNTRTKLEIPSQEEIEEVSVLTGPSLGNNSL